jgi:hypothetical protein
VVLRRLSPHGWFLLRQRLTLAGPSASLRLCAESRG